MIESLQAAALPLGGMAILIALAAGWLAYAGAPLVVWLAAAALGLWITSAPGWSWAVLLSLAAVALIPPLRRLAVTGPLLRLARRTRILPRISGTEREALEAGTVWIDGELFSGRPDWSRILAEPRARLTDEEQRFLDGPVEEVCRLTDDWEVFRRRDLPAGVWDRLKREGFFGLVIPRAYGGLGFSASGHSAVIGKLASRSTALAVTVMVPNSLGPAELLLHHGTEEQRRYWLPRLARGEEVPCFALTEPEAGSDAGSMRAEGVVFRGEDGQPRIRLSWDKRYITLGSVATVLGLAFRLRDPEDLLGKGPEPGITCALVPADTPGVDVSLRHDPMGVPFVNTATRGRDVVVPASSILGGPAGAGRGWPMLMESLAAGRGISLPALSAAGAKMVARVAGAYAAVRRQFGLPIGRFEGIQEPLARIGTSAYLLEAARRLVCGGIDRGAKPPVVSAIAKVHFTETFRRAVQDGMDILGGAGISRGPRNLLAHAYIGAPIGITVEGANILTRSLVIFGQGAIRCHPWVLREIHALEAGDVRAFDQALRGHVLHVIRNGTRALALAATRGTLARAPVDGPAARWFRKLSWCSATFAFLADLAMAGLGSNLKRRESIAGRFADVLAGMLLGTAVLRRFEEEGRRGEDLPFLDASMHRVLAGAQHALEGILRNLDVPLLRPILRGPLLWLARANPLALEAPDTCSQAVARALQQPGALRDRLTPGLFLPREGHEALARLERALDLCAAADPLERKVKDAVRDGRLAAGDPARRAAEAAVAGILTPGEAESIRRAAEAREDVIQVDAFRLADYLATAARALPREEDGEERGPAADPPRGG